MRRIKLGGYPHLKLQDARTLAKRRLIGPRPSEDAPAASTLVEQYLATHHAKSRQRTRDEQERLLEKHVLSRCGTAPLNRVSTADLVAITDGLVESKPSEALHAHCSLKTFFKWASPVIDKAEVTQFCEIWYRNRREPTAGEHKQLNGILDRAVEHFSRLDEEEKCRSSQQRGAPGTALRPSFGGSSVRPSAWRLRSELRQIGWGVGQ